MSLLVIVVSQRWLELYFRFVFNLINLLFLCFDKYKKFSSEIWIKYFFIQRISALVIILLLFFSFPTVLFVFIIIKLILPPFHLWFLNRLKFISINNLFIVLILQKLPFFLLLVTLKIRLVLFSSFLLLILSIRLVGILLYNKLRNQLFFSSVTQSFWVLISLKIKVIFFLQFYLIYFFTTLLLFLSFLNKIYLNQIFLSFFSSILFFVYIRIPPFPLFWFKWSMIYFILMISSFLLFFSFLSIIFPNYIYLKWFFLSIINQNLILKFLFLKETYLLLISIRFLLI